jgi:hypothetical protein
MYENCRGDRKNRNLSETGVDGGIFHMNHVLFSLRIIRVL